MKREDRVCRCQGPLQSCDIPKTITIVKSNTLEKLRTPRRMSRGALSRLSSLTKNLKPIAGQSQGRVPFVELCSQRTSPSDTVPTNLAGDSIDSTISPSLQSPNLSTSVALVRQNSGFADPLSDGYQCPGKKLPVSPSLTEIKQFYRESKQISFTPSTPAAGATVTPEDYFSVACLLSSPEHQGDGDDDCMPDSLYSLESTSWEIERVDHNIPISASYVTASENDISSDQQSSGQSQLSLLQRTPATRSDEENGSSTRSSRDSEPGDPNVKGLPSSKAARAITPTELDVLSGRGYRIRQWTGNRMLRDLGYAYYRNYTESKRGEKKKVVEEIISAIKHQRGGRFLKKCSNGEWTELNREETFSKVSQMIRENS